jgi:hypothetical protein
MAWGGTTFGHAAYDEVPHLKRIALVTIGTQGDVQPYIGLALALQERGYAVALSSKTSSACMGWNSIRWGLRSSRSSRNRGSRMR